MRNALGIDRNGPRTSALSAEALTTPIAVKAWRGASSRRYTHTVYHFVGCPAFKSAVYLFARRTASGHRAILDVAFTESDVPSVNLAALRQRGALLGATEIHVHEVEGPLSTSAQIAFDLATALLRSPDAKSAHS